LKITLINGTSEKFELNQNFVHTDFDIRLNCIYPHNHSGMQGLATQY